MGFATAEKLRKFWRSYIHMRIFFLPAWCVGIALLIGGFLTLLHMGIDRRYLLLGLIPGVLWFMAFAVTYLKHMVCPHCGSPLVQWALLSLPAHCYDCKHALVASEAEASVGGKLPGDVEPGRWVTV